MDGSVHKERRAHMANTQGRGREHKYEIRNCLYEEERCFGMPIKSLDTNCSLVSRRANDIKKGGANTNKKV